MEATRRSRVAEVLDLTAEEIEDMVKHLGLSQEGKDVFFLNLTDEEWNQGPAIRAAVAYKPRNRAAARALTENDKLVKTVHEFFSYAAKNPKTEGEIPTEVVVADTEHKLYANCDPKTDLSFFILLSLKRGYNVSKILLKCDSKAAAFLRRKCMQYRISMTPKPAGEVIGSSTITLARLAQAFAPVTAALILENVIKGKIKGNLFPGVTLPILMEHMIFPRLIRKSDTELIEVAKYLILEAFVTLASPKEKRKLEQTLIGDLYYKSESFVNVEVRESSLLLEDDRKLKVLIKGLILTAEGKPTTVVQAMYAICRKMAMMQNSTYITVVAKNRELLPQARPDTPDSQ